MERYRNERTLDNPSMTDGDGYFTGFWSRYQPTYLTEGQASFAGNMRMNRGTAQVRKGLKALSNDITLVNPPLIVGAFSLAPSVSISSLTQTGNLATATTATAHGYSSTNKVNIRGATLANYNGDYTITVTGANTFTYTIAGNPVSPAVGTLLANKGPRLFNNYNSQVVGSGSYADSATNTEGIVIASTAAAYLYRYGQSTITISYPNNETCDVGSPCDVVQFINQVYIFRGLQTAVPLAVTSVTSSSTTATVTTTASHGLATLAWVTIAGAAPAGYNGIYQITVTGANTFTYTIGSTLSSPATGTITARPCKPPMVWNLSLTSPAFTIVNTGANPVGAPIIYMPAVDWGQFFVSRFVLPYAKDQIIFSDILGPNNYDPSQNQFRILPGTADWIVAAYPYQEARLLLLYRKSIHAVILDNTSLAIAQSFEITRAFGCVARKTVANCGPSILWLSDQGVVQLSISDVLSLTNTSAPLSDPIQDQIDTINWAAASASVGVFFKNRYYLAVPTGTSTVNNSVFVYNFLNQAWESIDTFPAGYDVQGFHIMSYNGTERLHTVSTAGYVYLTEENQFDEWGAPNNTKQFAINGSLKTRNYLCDTYDLKKVRRFQLEANVNTGDMFTGQWVLSNPDFTFTAMTYTAPSTTDVSLRALVNRRGVSGRLELQSTSGRPEFKAVQAEAQIISRTTNNFT